MNEQSTQLAVRGDVTLDAMPTGDLVRQVQMIQEVMKTVMKEGEHFGVIPGTGKKPSLLKPGAEKLGFVFRLAPRFDITLRETGSHREYEVRCHLEQIHTGRFFGSGVGTCSTMEGKYRYRSEVLKGEDGQPVPVPKEYWEARDSSLLGGAQYSAKKEEGRWVIAHKVDHDNPADYYNTVLKMAKKRAHVDAILTATSASDIFTQDIEDMPQSEGRTTHAEQSQTTPPAPEEQVLEGPLTEAYVFKGWTIGVVKGVKFATNRLELSQALSEITIGTTVRVVVKKFVKDGKTKFRPQSIEVLTESHTQEETQPEEPSDDAG